eukprot:GHVN01077883.1.p1 GENE.GHVN01077883.1~~GHVN01077883.1.p1  ORF type:complete len:122 (-),score=1.29 GHVN01077883.1:16-381(-)
MTAATSPSSGVDNHYFTTRSRGYALYWRLPLIHFVTASIYSAMMSIRNLGGAISKANSAIAARALGITATNFSRLPFYIFLCATFLLAPLCFLRLLPDDVETVMPGNQSDSSGSVDGSERA